jgi:hypothetical protein
MLTKQCCPHTGVLNFFKDIEPFFSIGSIVETAPSRYVWRCHLIDHCCGIATDVVSAEANLRKALQMWGVLPSQTYARREFSRAA